MSEYQSTYNKIISRLHTTRRKETGILFFNGFLNTLAITASVILVASLIETIARGDSTFRGVLAIIILLGFAAAFVYFAAPSIIRALGIKNLPSLELMALRVGSVYPDVKDRLCNGIQLVSNLSKSAGTSQNLAVAAFEGTSQVAVAKDFDAVIDKQKTKKSLLYFFSSIVVSAIVFVIFSSSLGASLHRIMNYDKSFLPPAPFSLSVEPKDARIIRGESIKILVKAQGKAPETVVLYLKEEQQENFDAYTLRLDSGGVYKYELTSIKRSVTFYAESPWLGTFVRTEEGNIKVTDKPLVRSLSGKIVYPSYTKLAPKVFNEQTADISALRGSKLDLQIISNKDLKDARIYFEKLATVADLNAEPGKLAGDTTSYPMMVNGRQASGVLPVYQSGTYYIVIKDKDGQINTEPVKYDLVALNDEYPTITLIEPTMDVQVADDAILVIKTAITDDFGFSALKLHYRLMESRYTKPSENFSLLNVPLLSQDNTAEITYMWDLNKIGISPADKYEFYLEVFDNDRVSGPKSSKTNTLTVKLPSLEEVLETADEQQKKLDNDIEKVLKKAEDVKKDMEQLNRDLQKKQNQASLDWKEKKKAEDIMKKQADIQSKLSEIQKNLEQMTKNLDENKALSPETLEKYMELQKLMKEVNAPELQKMQQQLQQAFNKMTPEEIQKAMKNVKFDEEQFRKSIERTMKILKRLQAEQKVDALTKKAEELADKMDALDKQLQNTNPNDKQKKDELAKQQKGMKEDLNSINKDLKDLEKLMKEVGDMPMKEMDKAKDELNFQETSEAQQDAQEQMQDGDMKKSSQSQKKASKSMKNFAQQMKKLKKEMDNKITKEAIRQMQKAISDLLQLSKKQEITKSQTKGSDYNSTQYSDISEQQSQELESMMNVTNAMMELSQKSFAVTPEMGKQLGTAIQKMQQAMQQLAGRQTSAAATSQEQAMSAMNQAAGQMQSMLAQMQGSGSCNNPGGTGPGGKQGSNPGPGGQGFMERLQGLAGQQQAINQSMQQMQQGQNGQLSMEQQAELGRISKEQGKAQKSMEDLAKEQKQFGGDRKTLGNLDKIAQEMKEIVSDMQSGQVTPETMKRQERILSRLLDATKSMNERDYEKKRESKTGKQYDRQSPEALNLKNQEGKTRAMQDLLRSIQQGYTKDYETLIRQYFESIQNVDIKVQ